MIQTYFQKNLLSCHAQVQWSLFRLQFSVELDTLAVADLGLSDYDRGHLLHSYTTFQ